MAHRCRGPRSPPSPRRGRCRHRRARSRSSECSGWSRPRAPVAGQRMARRQPSISTTSSSSASRPGSSRSPLIMRASSPTVSPCAIGIWKAADERRVAPARARSPRHSRRRADWAGRARRTAMRACGRRLHGEAHGRDVGVEARADVLHVEDEHVEVGQHVGRRLVGAAVEAVDANAGRRVAPAGDLGAGLGRAGEPVLRASGWPQA